MFNEKKTFYLFIFTILNSFSKSSESHDAIETEFFHVSLLHNHIIILNPVYNLHNWLYSWCCIMLFYT